MSINQHLTESQLKRKVIRISSKKKDYNLQNKQNTIPGALRKNLCIQSSIDPSEKDHSHVNSHLNSIITEDQCYLYKNQSIERPFYMETSRFREAAFIRSFNQKKSQQLSIDLLKFVQTQKQIGRNIWKGKNIINTLFIKKYFPFIKGSPKIKLFIQN